MTGLGASHRGIRKPDFFIVGAPKCGTTALYHYLAQHPQIYMPFIKEPLYFGSDLGTRYGRMTLHAYEELFAGAQIERRIGEASAWYLYSRRAAAEIKAYNPAARIIVLLRDPVEVMHAQHSQLLFNQQEDVSDFAAALALEPERREGRRIPSGAVRPENLYYRDMVRFPEQLRRYFGVFGRDRVHVIVFDDFRADTAATYRETLRFLDVDADFRPSFTVENPNKRVRNRAIQRLIYQPPPLVRRFVPVLRRHRFVHLVRGLLLSANSRPGKRGALDPDLVDRLRADMADEIEELGELIGRDLSKWSRREV